MRHTGPPSTCTEKSIVAEKVDPSKNVNDTACPRTRLPRSERARALPAEHLGHRACQVPVFRVEVLVTDVVSQADDLLVDRQHHFWNRVQARGISHRNSLIDRDALCVPRTPSVLIT